MQIDGDLAEILGIHIGDGCISKNNRYQEYYLGGDITEEKEYHDTWVGPLFNKKVAIPVIGREVNYKEHPKVGVYGFYIFNNKLVSFFENLGIKAGTKINVEIPKAIMGNKGFAKRFLRGLFDTDGSLYFDRNKLSKKNFNNRPVIKLGTVSERLARQVHDLLINLGFYPRLKRPYQGKRDKHKVYTVLLYRVSDIEKFISRIGFKNSKHHSKWEIYKQFGICPPHTKLRQRKEMLQNPKIFNSYLTT
jgi:intein/homing endonuclease